jgi:hypothetical protein
MAKTKCEHEGCGKKLDITAFPCKCQKKFCPAHRYASDHDCTFDYQGSAKQILLKTMSTPVVAAKVEAI